MSLSASPARPANRFDQLADRFTALRNRAAAESRPVLALVLQGYASLSRDLAKSDLSDRWNVADPAASVPDWLLTPDGRYCCDGCEAATERADLVERHEGFLCPGCAQAGARS